MPRITKKPATRRSSRTQPANNSPVDPPAVVLNLRRVVGIVYEITTEELLNTRNRKDAPAARRALMNALDKVQPTLSHQVICQGAGIKCHPNTVYQLRDKVRQLDGVALALLKKVEEVVIALNAGDKSKLNAILSVELPPPVELTPTAAVQPEETRPGVKEAFIYALWKGRNPMGAATIVHTFSIPEAEVHAALVAVDELLERSVLLRELFKMI
ncbi:MAG: hypothetical protein Q7R93_00170 [bacterium]|nr:hypothetical protein [bacterium]